MKIKCDCSGALKRAWPITNFDLSTYFGFSVQAERVKGWRCGRCGWETIPGALVDELRHVVAAALLAQTSLLAADRARFLRKYLRYTQAESASKMGVTRKTVNQWENRGTISPQHDLTLRALVFAQMPEAHRPSPEVLGSVRTSRRYVELKLPAIRRKR